MRGVLENGRHDVGVAVDARRVMFATWRSGPD
jgi:hypothetical protein